MVSWSAIQRRNCARSAPELAPGRIEVGADEQQARGPRRADQWQVVLAEHPARRVARGGSGLGPDRGSDPPRAMPPSGPGQPEAAGHALAEVARRGGDASRARSTPRLGGRSALPWAALAIGPRPESCAATPIASSQAARTSAPR